MPLDRVRWGRLAVAVWAGVILALSGLAAVWPRAHSVYPIFANAGHNWLAGADLYGPQAGRLDHYRYSPLAATLFVPFSLMPERLGNVLWRLVGVGVYLVGLAWWVRTVLPRRLRGAERGVFWLLVVPLSLGSLHNGQSNVLLLGLLLAAGAAVATGRWWLASACVSGACLFKVYAVALGLLLGVVYPRRFAGRWAVALAVGVALPFLCQRPGYVGGQSARWVSSLWMDDDRQGWPVAQTYRDFRLLCRVWLVPLSTQAYLAVQVLAGAAMAAVCLVFRRAGWPQQRLLTMLLALACCWMTAFGPATESCTYTLLAPALAWSILETWADPRRPWARVVRLISYGLCVLAQTALWLPGGTEVGKLGLQPLAALLLLGSVVGAEVHRMIEDRHQRGRRALVLPPAGAA